MYAIATCRNRKQKQYFNQEMNWDEFIANILTTTRTKETVDEYKHMTKDQQSDIKDVGGFVTKRRQTKQPKRSIT